MMKINILCKTIILFGLVLIFSCGQDPIFYTISTEPVPVKPRIQGSPTNMAAFKRNGDSIMYVASGGLHWYAKTGWDSAEYRIPQPGGKIIGLAATNEYLYALSISISGATTILRRIGSADGKWNDIIILDETKYTLIQSIFTVTDKGMERLFAGARNNSGSDYGILFLDDTSDPALRLIIPDTEMLSGAASRGGFHYLSTRGKGVYKVSDADLLAKVPSVAQQLKDDQNRENRLFMGMIKLEDESIIVVERNGGTLFEVQESGFRQIKYSNGETLATGKFSTGALAVWQNVNNEKEKMLIAGIQGALFSTTTTTSYTHGYVEFYLTSEGLLDLTRSRNDPPTITVHNTDRYTATIGKYPINYFFQASSDIDTKMTFFASTQTAGLWSYRDRDGGWQWNAEN